MTQEMKELLPDIVEDYFEIDKKNINIIIKDVNDINELVDCLYNPYSCLDEYINKRLNKNYNLIKEELSYKQEFPTFKELSSHIFDYILKNKFQKFENILSTLIKEKIKRIKTTDDLSVHDPNEMYKVNDDINDEFISSMNPLAFSEDRISPLIVIDNDVLIGNNSMHHESLIEKYKEKHHLTDDDINSRVAYDEGYDQFEGKNVGVGSLFNGKVALLEYVTGELDENNIEGQQSNSGNIKAIANTLKANGIQKVYISSVPWNSPAIYKRVAKKCSRLNKNGVSSRLKLKVFGRPTKNPYFNLSLDERELFDERRNYLINLLKPYDTEWMITKYFNKFNDDQLRELEMEPIQKIAETFILLVLEENPEIKPQYLNEVKDLQCKSIEDDIHVLTFMRTTDRGFLNIVKKGKGIIKKLLKSRNTMKKLDPNKTFISIDEAKEMQKKWIIENIIKKFDRMSHIKSYISSLTPSQKKDLADYSVDDISYEYYEFIISNNTYLEDEFKNYVNEIREQMDTGKKEIYSDIYDALYKTIYSNEFISSDKEMISETILTMI